MLCTTRSIGSWAKKLRFFVEKAVLLFGDLKKKHYFCDWLRTVAKTWQSDESTDSEHKRAHGRRCRGSLAADGGTEQQWREGKDAAL